MLIRKLSALLAFFALATAGMLAAPEKAHATTVCASPSAGQGTGARTSGGSISGGPSKTRYQLNQQGCASVQAQDVPFYLSNGFYIASAAIGAASSGANSDITSFGSQPITVSGPWTFNGGLTGRIGGYQNVVNATDATYAGGADPSDVRDSTAAIQAAANQACVLATAATPGVVWLPGGTYQVNGTVTVTCNHVLFQGASYGGTNILSTGTGDVFFISGSGTGWTTSDISFDSISGFRTDNVASGVFIHYKHNQESRITNVKAKGWFGDIQFESVGNVMVSNVFFGGGNTTPGSFIMKADRALSADFNNSTIQCVNCTITGSTPNAGYTNALVINNSDGIWFSGGHIGFTSGAALLAKPGFVSDAIDNVHFSNVDFDSSGNCMDFETITSFTGAYNSIDIKGGTCELSTGDGVVLNATSLTGFHYTDFHDILNGGRGALINSGANIEMHGIFNGNETAQTTNTEADLDIEGGSHIDADNSIFTNALSSSVQAKNHIVVAGSADYVHASNEDFIGVGTTDLSVTTSGYHNNIGAATSTDQSTWLDIRPDGASKHIDLGRITVNAYTTVFTITPSSLANTYGANILSAQVTTDTVSTGSGVLISNWNCPYANGAGTCVVLGTNVSNGAAPGFQVLQNGTTGVLTAQIQSGAAGTHATDGGSAVVTILTNHFLPQGTNYWSYQ